MSRYIDADAIKYFVSVTNDGCFYRVAFKDEIDKIPTADVVPSKYGCGSAPYCSWVFEVDEDE